MEISQKAIQNVPIYRAGNVSRQWVENGYTDGWMPVFSTPQSVLTQGTNDPGFTTLDEAAAVGAVIDLAGADGFALMCAGVPGAASTFNIQIWLLEPVKTGAADKPITYSWNNITEASGANVVSVGTNVAPGPLVGYFGLTSAHRFSENLATAGSSTPYVSAPYLSGGRKGRMHCWVFGAPFAVIRLWRTGASNTDQLQALWRPLCVNEVRGSVLGA